MKVLILLALFVAAVAAFEPQAIRLPNAPVPAYETVPDISPLFIPSAVLEELATKFADPSLRGKLSAGFAQPEPVMLADAPVPEVEEPVQSFEEVSQVKVADLSFADEEISQIKVADLSFANEEISQVVPAYETVADISPLFIPSAVLEELATKFADTVLKGKLPAGFAQPEPVMLADAPVPKVEEPVQSFEEVSKVKVADLSFANEEISQVKVADLSFANKEISQVKVADLSFANEEISQVKVADLSFANEEISQVKVADLSFANEEVSKVKVADLSFANEEPYKVNFVDVPVAVETYQFDVVDAVPAELSAPVEIVQFINESPIEPVKVANIQMKPVNVASIPVSPVQVASIDNSQFMYADPRLR